MQREYLSVEQELIREIAKEKHFWKKVGKIITLNALLRKQF